MRREEPGTGDWGEERGGGVACQNPTCSSDLRIYRRALQTHLSEGGKGILHGQKNY